jgi:hypothetical protein
MKDTGAGAPRMGMDVKGKEGRGGVVVTRFDYNPWGGDIPLSGTIHTSIY